MGWGAQFHHGAADIGMEELARKANFNAPIDLLIAGFATPSDNVFWVSQADVCALGIKLWSNDTKRFVCN